MFKREQGIVKILIGENCLDSFVKTTKEFKKFDEVDDVEEIFRMKKNSYKA